ncbi:MAG: aspartic peptidase domain-containing protein [Linnemannia elongata]|nr:MAG: aspartic peptidase domain-containing protein [Linnemannia elongata]
MLLKFSAAVALLCASTTVAAAGMHTVQMDRHSNPAHRNADAATKRYLHKRYLHKRGIISTSPLTSVSGDIIYSVPLGLGTPAQQFNLAIDTGSPITWVVAKSCISSICSNVSHRFDCAASSSCQQTSTPFNISYVDSSKVAGSYISEQYTLGKLSFEGAVGLVSDDSSAMGATVDGIMGLWYYPQGSDVPILNVLKNTSALIQPQIGVWLKGSGSEANAPGGEITFGGADTSKYSGNISYVNCAGDSPWTIPVGGMTVNGKTIDTSGAMATLDTGTSLMLVSQTVSDAINGAIPGALKDPKDGWFLPCKGNYPITITFGTRQITIPYSSLAVQDQTATTNDGSTVCLSAAMYPTGDTASISDWLLGDAFLKNVYTVFDFSTTKGRIGIASLGSGGSASQDNTNGNDNAAGGRGAMLSSMLQALTVVAVVVVTFA